MDELLRALDALANKSGGGVAPSETIGAQGIRGVAMFLDDGRVAFVKTEVPQ